jgi:hypothetical protein
MLKFKILRRMHWKFAAIYIQHNRQKSISFHETIIFNKDFVSLYCNYLLSTLSLRLNSLFSIQVREKNSRKGAHPLQNLKFCSREIHYIEKISKHSSKHFFEFFSHPLLLFSYLFAVHFASKLWNLYINDFID